MVKYRVHLEPNVGQPIHLIEPSTADDRSARLSAEDKHLLRREQDEVQDLYARSGGASGSSGSAPLSAFGNSMSARNIADGVHLRQGKHWLRKTVYMDNLQHGSIHNYATGNQKRLENVEREQRLLHGNSNRLTKGERIEQSFKLAKEMPVHQTKKELKPVKVLSLLPSFELSQHMLYAVQFLDDNVLDDELLDQSQLDPKGRVVHKRGRQILLEYTPAQVRTLESGVLEQVNREAVNQISFLVPGAPLANKGGKGPGAPDAADEADSDFGEDSEEDELTRKPKQASSSTKGGNGDQEYLKWIRDYSYKTTTFKPCERFGMVWKKSTVEAPGDVNNVLYDSVRFVELAGARIDCTRTQTDEWDSEGSRSKRIKVDRRLTADEHDTVTNRLRDIQEVDITSGDSQQDDEDEAERRNSSKSKSTSSSSSSSSSSRRRSRSTRSPRSSSSAPTRPSLRPRRRTSKNRPRRHQQSPRPSAQPRPRPTRSRSRRRSWAAPRRRRAAAPASHRPRKARKASRMTARARAASSEISYLSFPLLPFSTHPHPAPRPGSMRSRLTHSDTHRATSASRCSTAPAITRKPRTPRWSSLSSGPTPRRSSQGAPQARP